MVTENDVCLKIQEFFNEKNKNNKFKKRVIKVDLTELDVDSLNFVELIVFLEKAFNCEFDDYTLIFSQKRDFAKLISYICKKCNSQEKRSAAG